MPHLHDSALQAFSTSRAPDDLKSTSPRRGDADRTAAAAVRAPPQRLTLGPAAVQDFTALFALPDMTPGALHGMRLELSPRRVRCLYTVTLPI